MNDTLKDPKSILAFFIALVCFVGVIIVWNTPTVEKKTESTEVKVLKESIYLDSIFKLNKKIEELYVEISTKDKKINSKTRIVYYENGSKKTEDVDFSEESHDQKYIYIAKTETLTVVSEKQVQMLKYESVYVNKKEEVKLKDSKFFLSGEVSVNPLFNQVRKNVGIGFSKDFFIFTGEVKYKKDISLDFSNDIISTELRWNF